jgi:hypothetical protein
MEAKDRGKVIKRNAIPGPGRPREREEPMVPMTIKLEPSQKEKLQRLGGAPWVRKKIDQAPEPN